MIDDIQWRQPSLKNTELLQTTTMLLGCRVFRRLFSSMSEGTGQSMLLKEQVHSNTIEIWTLNRAQARNSLCMELLKDLENAVTSAEQSKGTVRAIILRANGNVFCSGHDLKEIYGVTTESKVQFNEELFRLCSKVMLSLRQLPQVVIAQVHGVATAAGCQLVAACDLAYAAEEATFATPGVNIGLFCSTPAVPLVRAVARKQAAEMLFLGQPISATRAREIGLINDVVPKEALEETVLNVAKLITSKSASTIAFGKQVLHKQMEAPSEHAAYEIASRAMVENLQYRDAKEGIEAFITKRPPKWLH